MDALLVFSLTIESKKDTNEIFQNHGKEISGIYFACGLSTK